MSQVSRASYLFIGDSITDCERREDPESLGYGYVRVLAGSLASVDVVNRGVAGDRVQDVLNRWDPDCISIGADLVSVLVGINDTWRRYDSGIATTARKFEHDYRSMLDALTRARPRTEIVLIEPFLLPVSPDQERWLEDLEPKIAAVHALAEEFSATIVPSHSPLGERAALIGPEAIVRDGVHPTPLGHRLLADEWIKAVGYDRVRRASLLALGRDA